MVYGLWTSISRGFAALGAKHELINGAVISVQADRLLGSHIYLDVVSVGATMNIMLAAVKAEGLTVIENAAKEPHIVDLANFLNSMGADVRGAGNRRNQNQGSRASARHYLFHYSRPD